jgi:hypothetical protein
MMNIKKAMLISLVTMFILSCPSDVMVDVIDVHCDIPTMNRRFMGHLNTLTYAVTDEVPVLYVYRNGRAIARFPATNCRALKKEAW